MYSRRGHICFNVDKWYFRNQQYANKSLPGVHPHRWSGSVCLRFALPRLPRLWQGKRRFHLLFLSIGKKFFVNIFDENQFLYFFADLQARPGQQCVHLPWCQPGGHCCRSGYLTYSTDLTWVDNFDSVDHFPPPGIHHISDGVFLSAAEALADMVSEEDLAVGR